MRGIHGHLPLPGLQLPTSSSPVRLMHASVLAPEQRAQRAAGAAGGVQHAQRAGTPHRVEEEVGGLDSQPQRDGVAQALQVDFIVQDSQAAACGRVTQPDGTTHTRWEGRCRHNCGMAAAAQPQQQQRGIGIPEKASCGKLCPA